METYEIKINPVELGIMTSIFLEKFTDYPSYKIPLQNVYQQLEDLYLKIKNGDCGCSESKTI